MTKNEAVARILEGLGFRTDLQAAAERRLREVQEQREQGLTLPWFLVREDQALTVEAGLGPVALPDDFLREVEFNTLRYRDSDGSITLIEKKDYDRILQTWAGKPAGLPQVYALRTKSFFFLPVADQEYVLFWDYYAKDDVLSSSVETNRWLTYAPLVLVGAAGLSLARTIRNKLAVEEFGAMLMEAEQRVFKESIARQEAARSRYLGSNR